MSNQPETHPLVRTKSSRRLRWILAVTGILVVAGLLIESTRWQALPRELPIAVQLSDPAMESASQPARRAVEIFLAENRVAGLSVCVATDHAPGWCLAAGYADLESGAELRSDQPLRLGSVSKPVTATILGRLTDAGTLELEDRIGGGLELPGHLAPLTLAQLASHTAGVRHYRWRLGWPPHETLSRTRYPRIVDSLTLFVADPLAFEPGAGFNYSSYGYSLLGAALEKASGRSFAELLGSEIAAPTGLTTLALDDGAAGDAGVAYYQPVGGWARDALRSDPSRSWPGAGLVASAEDLARFGAAFASGSLVTPETMDEMLTERRLPGDQPNPQGYGIGWRIAHTQRFLGGDKKYRVAHHGGITSGASAFLLVFPDEGVAVSLLSNTGIGSGPLSSLAFEVAEPFVALLDDRG